MSDRKVTFTASRPGVRLGLSRTRASAGLSAVAIAGDIECRRLSDALLALAILCMKQV